MRQNGLFGGFDAAVSLAFDDGIANQLTRAVPTLDEFGILGTSCLHARDGNTMDAAALLGQRVDRMSGVRISVEQDEFRRLLTFLADRTDEVNIAPAVDVVTSIRGPSGAD